MLRHNKQRNLFFQFFHRRNNRFKFIKQNRKRRNRKQHKILFNKQHFKQRRIEAIQRKFEQIQNKLVQNETNLKIQFNNIIAWRSNKFFQASFLQSLSFASKPEIIFP